MYIYGMKGGNEGDCTVCIYGMKGWHIVQKV